MRDTKRIPAILKQLEALWMSNPDLRLGQLILNAVPEERLFYTEDAALVNYVSLFILAGKND